MIRPDNTRSIRVARRLGLTPLRDDVLLDTPVIVYWINRETWTTRRHRSSGPDLRASGRAIPAAADAFASSLTGMRAVAVLHDPLPVNSREGPLTTSRSTPSAA